MDRAGNLFPPHTKLCRGECGQVKPLAEFSGRHLKCKKCLTIHIRNRINTIPKVFFQALLGHARCSAKERKGDAQECSLTLQDIQELHETQAGLCYYSGISYNLQRLSDWMCSLERLDPSRGYVHGNVALVACEFQSPSQWTTDKFDDFIRLLNMNHERQGDIEWYPPKTRRPMQKTVVSEVDGVRYCVCKQCQQTKTIENFYTNLRSGCKECEAKRSKLYKQTAYGHMTRVLGAMRPDTRDKAEHRNIPGVTLTIPDLIAMFERQGGLCAYSGIPMTFGAYTDKWWTCSPERIDATKGYSVDNVCLICFEFNTPDRSSVAVSTEYCDGDLELVKGEN
jgi:hypothetical protein